MNQEMEDAMKLEIASSPIQIEGETMEVSVEAASAQGMGLSQQYMARNGGLRPNYKAQKLVTITKAQLKEQQMNEEAGYPSSLNETEKVKAMEVKVEEMGKGIEAILAHLSNQSVSVATPSSEPMEATLLLPDVKPVTETILPSSPLRPLQTDSTESSVRQVTLNDGRTIKIPNLNLGPATSGDNPNFVDESAPDVVQVPEESNWDDHDDVVSTIAPQWKDEEENDPRAERVQTLVQNVYEFMRAGDCHRYFRRHITAIHRHLTYDSWKPDFKTEFDKRFKGFLDDTTFVTNLCGKIIDMELGHIIGAKQATSMIVITAGFTSFALCGIPG